LQGNAKDFHRRFHAIRESTIQCLERCKFSVVTLVSILRPVCTSQHKKFLEENYGPNKSEDYRKLFGQMDPYWDYLSFDQLAILVKELCSHNASFIPIEDEITVYKKDLRDFKMHTTLTLFCQALPHEDYDPPQIILKMVTEYQWPETVTLEDVEMFMKTYSLPYKLQTLAMMVNSVRSKMETRAATSEVQPAPCDTASPRDGDKCVVSKDQLFKERVFFYTGNKFDFIWEEAGISLLFPAAYVMEKIKISVQVIANIEEQIMLPKRYRFMPAASSAYKITASTTLPAPVRVRMEHCAVVEKADTLTLMVAHEGPPYCFEELPGAKINSFYGEIELKCFCIFRFFWNLLWHRPMRLSTQVFYHADGTATFAVTKKLKDHVKAVRDTIKHINFEDTRMSCGFKSNAITLSVPALLQGWQITPSFAPAEIPKYDIETYEPGETCPHIKLCMEWKGSGEPKQERVSIPIGGCSKTSFALLCKPTPRITQETSVVQPNETTPEALQNRPTLPLLQRLPKCSGGVINILQEIAPRNHDFGIALFNDESGKITANIEIQHKHDLPTRTTKAILERWLEGTGRPPSWATLIAVLREIELNTLAKDIADNLSTAVSQTSVVEASFSGAIPSSVA
jgi:hypothetical protein